MRRLIQTVYQKFARRDDLTQKRAPAPPIERVALGLAIGALGGLVAHWAHVPLAFMLGALFATIFASAAGAPVAASNRLRAAFLVLVGLFLGQSFEAGEAERMLSWPLSIAMAILYVPVASGLVFLFYERVAGWPRLSALFSAIPGGLSAVIMFSAALGADERDVALSQSLRIAIVVLTAPAIVFGVLGYVEPSLLHAEVTLLTLPEIGWLVLGCGAAYAVLVALGAPIPFLMAPLLGSAVVRLAGLVTGELPGWMVEVALVVTGSSIGCRFAGTSGRVLLTLALWTVAGTTLLMLIAAVFALVASHALGLDLLASMLAFAPGGVAEMCLIALALDADPAFVAAHHLARIVFILVLTPLFAVWVRRRML
ncbi:MAG: AbrB family transcriptional regulator [Pseudomonadota bacterium]